MNDEKKLAQFLSLIIKQVGYVLRHPDHEQYREDIVNETFIKLFKSGAFEKYSLDTSENGRIAAAYIKKTIHSCSMDYFSKSGIYRRLTKREQESTGLKTQSITNENFDDLSANATFFQEDTKTYTSEQYLIAKEAYGNIQKCFSLITASITNDTRAKFLKEAFWNSDYYDVPIKQLAQILGYLKSNPTQDFNRFVDKISNCTQKYNIKIVNSGEQIEFLRQIISFGGEQT
ncbi:hypothetical protein [Glaciecola sp. HTCC2999]|uniref:hypothetical protein n=1 Tax=Glaciecola sp. HTCC2999 TaxID=455436 RepID=UPI0012EAD784|nr:hypothetical protein [Glaciecola sp. HTCC2999]